MVKAQKRQQNGRFGGEYTSRELLFEVLPAVAKAADSGNPASVSMRAWTAARAKAGYPDAPTANAVHLRLNAGPAQRSWRELLATALAEERNHSQALAALFRAPADEHLDDDAVYYALRLVAKERGWETFSHGQYEQARAELLTQDARRKHGGLLPDLLPTGQQIENYCHGWPAALALADLKPHKQRARANNPKAGLAGNQNYWNGERMVEALREYVRDYPDHDEASSRDYKARAVGRKWPSGSAINNHGYNFRDLLEEAKRRERGEQPQHVAPKRAPGGDGTPPKRGAYKWPPERIEREMRDYLADKDRLPGKSTFERDGKGPLYYAARHFHGLDHWAELLGKPRRRSAPTKGRPIEAA